MSNREDIPLVLFPWCDYIEDGIYNCCISCYRYDFCEKDWIRRYLMKYSLDFKPRVVFVGCMFIDPSIDFCFYDYNKHHDIKCYDRSGEEIPEETLTKTFDKYYSNSDLVYNVKHEYDHEMGNVWVCRAWDPESMLCFVGYSEFSAAHAIEDLENAKKLILGRYYKPKDNKPENINE